MRYFNNDYNEACHPAILKALTENVGVQMPGYGVDACSAEAAELIRKKCDAPNAAVHFLVGGTQTNLTVIAATAPCSTYDLLDAAEKVIVFGSTMGVESAYWGKPTILLAGAFYHELDVCYAPATPEEIYPLIECRDLPPKSREGAIRYGYYILNRTLLAIPNKYIDYALYKTGRKSYACGYAEFLGSRKLAYFIKKYFRQRSRYRTGLLPAKTS